MIARLEGDPDRWILQKRGPRNRVDVSRAVAAFVEDEATETGGVAAVATLFLANRECPWRCLMCDLWKNTTLEAVPVGAIPAQIRYGLAALASARRIKLYNSGSFFDPGAIPLEDYEEIGALVERFERVIVESHPALIGGAGYERLRDLRAGDLEVAMGLETAHPEVLERLNKRMSLDDFRRAADRLRADGVAMRAFVLLGIPFVSAEESLDWACRSIDFALGAGATAVAIVPTRTGNGALDELEKGGDFSPPTLSALETVSAYGVRLGRGRVFADLWDLARLNRCGECFPARLERLRAQNLRQRAEPRISCAACGERS